MNELEVENVGSAKYYISATAWWHVRKLASTRNSLTFLSDVGHP